jgi:transcriptional regulator
MIKVYNSKPFIVDDGETIFEFIEKNSFGILFSNHNGIPLATHLPLQLDRSNGYLRGHFARANSQWKDIVNQEVLAVFQGPHHYISSSWYETNMSVPTWNYVAVHVYGSVELIEDSNELFKTLGDLVKKYEEQGSSYHLDDSNKEFIVGMMNGIVGFKLKINKVEGKWKLSQNQSTERQMKVIDQLEQIQSEHAGKIAALMRQNLKSL